MVSSIRTYVAVDAYELACAHILSVVSASSSSSSSCTGLGPLVGEELLLLQGIPADDLLLTRESDKQLKDLAGNAMSTTVVGGESNVFL